MNSVKNHWNTTLKSLLLDLVIQFEEEGNYQDTLNQLVEQLKHLLPFKNIEMYSYQSQSKRFAKLSPLNQKNDSLELGVVFGKFKNTWPENEIFKHYEVTYQYIQANHDWYFLMECNNKLEFFIHFQDGYDNYAEIDREMPTLAHILGAFSHKNNLSIERRTSMQLYNVTSKMHSSIDLNDVLTEIVRTLHEVYPTFSHELYLTYDYDYEESLPIFGFDQVCNKKPANEAFISGELTFESTSNDNYKLFAPLKGQQAVYGVLIVTITEDISLSDADMRFIGILGQTAGKSIENAQLYTQSQKLIRNLQLINDTSHRLNSDLRIIEIVTYISKQIKKSTLAQLNGFLVFKPNGTYDVLAGSSSFFFEEESQAFIKQAIKEAHLRNEPMLITDLSEELQCRVNYKSAMLVPMQFSNDKDGMAIVLHEQPFAFTFDAFKLLQSLIYHCSLALSNSMLKSELEQLVITDYLTQLYSRSYLDLKIQKSITKDQNGTFILIDVDNFKQINDSYGHQTGDELLVQIATIIKGCIRELDIGARWGGEELAIYLPNASLQTGYVVAERISEQVKKETNPHITISCGVSYWGGEQLISPKQLFKNADDALYEAKNTGKNKIVLSSENHATL